MFVFHILGLLCLLSTVWSKPAPRRIARDGPTTNENAPAQSTICGDIIEAVDDGFVVFFASTAYECLTSVPFNAAVASRFIEYYTTTIQFQSTLAYLRDPPPEYQQPAVDVLGGLEIIRQNVTAGYYNNQYAFEADLQLLIYSMHDTHVVLTAGILSAFSFASPYAISSASVDGRQAPKIYITDDIIYSRDEGWQPSPIVAFNGIDTVSYLTEFASLNSVGAVEPHADWNLLMASPVLDIQGLVSVFSGATTFYPGDNLTFTFENGTDLETSWLAVYNNVDPTGPLTTGGDFYNYFVLGQIPASYKPSSSVDEPSPADDTSDGGNSVVTSWFVDSYQAYPDNPDIVQLDLSVTGGGIVTGYFLRDISTAVLSIPNFEASGWNVGNFSLAVQEFIDNAKTENLSRVIIDLQQNMGGNVELVFDIFKRFFPDKDPFAGSRRRSHELANVLGSVTTAHWESLSLDDSSYYYLAANEWVITNRLNAETGRNFTSWSEYYGPRIERGDSFSLNERYNLSSEIFNVAAFDGWIPYGYGPANPVASTPPWRSEDVVILTDGLCSSACSLFEEMMTSHAGVRTVTVGGRPTTGPMQAASGTRGARGYSADALDRDFEFASSVDQTASTSLPQVRDSGMYTTHAGINLRDQMRPDDQVPLQFKYEAANCRIYFTLANVYNMSRLWRDASTAVWDDASLCVEGSLGFATTGNTTVAKAPPPATPQGGVLNSSMINRAAAFNLEASGGLWNGLQPATRNAGIQLCDSTGGCLTGVCTDILTTCSNGNKLTARACLPPCQNRDGSDSCRGANVHCDIRNTQESKTATYGNTGTSRNKNFQHTLRTGLCFPTMGTAQLGCPVAPKLR